jgi:hypothetical protein
VAQRVNASVKVQKFGLLFDPTQRRLDFPHAEIDSLDGQAGKIQYTARELQLENLRAQLRQGQWQASAASAGAVALRDQDGKMSLDIGQLEFPRGLLFARAVAGNVELVTPHASLADVKLCVKGPFRRQPPPDAPPPPPTEPKPLRQDRLRFLDGVSGEIKMTLSVRLDLPVIGTRTLDQALRIPIKDGSLDFRALDKGLDWLEGAVIDIELEDRRLAVKWGVPVLKNVMPSREVISFMLDEDALTLARFDRVPLRSLVDFRTGGTKSDAGKDKDKDKDSKRKWVRSVSMDKIQLALSLLAPRSFEVGGGAILFGGDDAPGIVDFAIAGALHHPAAPGSLRGSIGLVDTTIKDLQLGGAVLTVDRLHLGKIEQLEVTFDGFAATEVTATIDRVTATNLALVLGGR